MAPTQPQEIKFAHGVIAWSKKYRESKGINKTLPAALNHHINYLYIFCAIHWISPSGIIIIPSTVIILPTLTPSFYVYAGLKLKQAKQSLA